jgi:putative transposase
MPNAYICNRVHITFSTSKRRNLIAQAIQQRLWAYMAGIAKRHRMHAIAIGGIENHAHLLLSLPADMDVARAVQVIKANSSRWMKPQIRFPFAWQRGYGAFSVSASATAAVVHYIENQPEHHRRMSFEDEFRSLLRRHGVEYDERYVFD